MGTADSTAILMKKENNIVEKAVTGRHKKV